MRQPYYASLLFFALAALSGCNRNQPAVVAAPTPVAPVASDILYSPNAEPLSGGAHGHPTCQVAMSAWFERTDLNRDGKVTRGEFMQDAQAQFTRMDIDHNTFLTADEINRYRASFRPAHAPMPVPASDPVLTADSHHDNKITPYEWLEQQSAVFDRLDSNHDMSLTREEVQAFCS